MSLCASWLRNVEFGEEGTEKVFALRRLRGPNGSRKQSAQDWHTRRSTELLVDLEHADVRLEAALVGVVPLRVRVRVRVRGGVGLGLGSCWRRPP